jgi:hypothetical protein
VTIENKFDRNWEFASISRRILNDFTIAIVDVVAMFGGIRPWNQNQKLELPKLSHSWEISRREELNKLSGRSQIVDVRRTLSDITLKENLEQSPNE